MGYRCGMVAFGARWVGPLLALGIVGGCSGGKSGESATEGASTTETAADDACMQAPDGGPMTIASPVSWPGAEVALVVGP